MGISLCVVGATGKFGRAVISQADSDVKIMGAVCTDDNLNVGKTISELGLSGHGPIINGASHIEEASAESDVVLFVSKPEADLTNIPKVTALRKRIVVGTTGFNTTQAEQLDSMLKTVPSVISTNFSVGANILFEVTELLSRFNNLYDYSIIEEHHKLKADAPSGTAKTMRQLLNRDSKFPVTITDRTARPKRMGGEVEVVSLRGGGTPGIHQLVLSGDHDMIRVEHTAFSRASMATGALLACKWIASQAKPGIYSMKDVLGLTQA
ncbi:MAG TPA: 4-hydroxy-tetrahydrodipicolinate reductase [Candidatus Acidoferrales bacterium]|nr:4-hydroxy-tetrahydrodipicolinate reductase [Candidatus Acidoferrales bacterium]